MTDLLVALATHALAGLAGWRAYRILDARWEPGMPAWDAMRDVLDDGCGGERQASMVVVRRGSVYDWEERGAL